MLGSVRKILGMGVLKIVEQMEKNDLKNQMKTIFSKKWLSMTLN
jgi:hypothetical protein